MKKIFTLTIITAFTCISFSAFSQEKKIAGDPQSTPMVAPAMKTQNNQNSSSQKTTQGTTNNNKKAKPETPPVENKIAVSDPGLPANKSNDKTVTHPHSSESKKTQNPPPGSQK